MVEIEQYFGFGANDYVGKGGLNDLLHKSDILEDVIAKLKEHKDSQNYFDDYWVTDMKNFKPVDVEI